MLILQSKLKSQVTQSHGKLLLNWVKIKVVIFSLNQKKTTGKFDRKNRSKAGIFVLNTKGGVKYEVSVLAGFKFKHRTSIIFDVDGKKTNFFSNEETAWSESAKVDRLLVQSMRKGKKLIVTGTSSLGNKIIDTYSLSGFTKALRLIDKDCSQNKIFTKVRNNV